MSSGEGSLGTVPRKSGPIASFWRSLAVTVAAVLALLLSWLAPASAEMTADVEVRMERGYGRLVLTFPAGVIAPVSSDRTSNGVFTLSFTQPVALDVDRITLSLGDYLTVVRRDPDGQAIRIALKRSVRPNVKKAGEMVFVDFLPAGWAGPPPPLPDEVVTELTRRAEEQLRRAQEAEARARRDGNEPAVDVRLGVTPTFSRLSFDWNVPFEAGFARTGNEVTVSFDRTAKADIEQIRSNLPELLTGIRTEEREEGLSFVLAVAPGARVRAFRDGKSYVVDLTSERMQAAAIGEAIAEIGADETPAPDDAAPMPSPAPSAEAESPPPSANPPPMAVAEGQPAPVASPAPPKQPSPPVVAEPALPPISPEEAAAPVSVSVAQVGDTIRLGFPFKEKVASAVFRRGRTLWLVFDTPAVLDLGAVRAVLDDRLSNIARESFANGQIVRLTLREAELAGIEAEGAEWVVTIGDLVAQRSTPVVFTRVVQPDGTLILKAPYAQAGRVHRLEDRDVGDTLIVATAFGPPRAILRPQTLAELQTLVSAHGIAVAPLADDVTLTLDHDEAIIARRGKGLTLSVDTAAAETIAPRPGEAARPGFIDLARWAAIAPENYSRTLNGLQVAIAAAEPSQRAPLRMNIAELTLANGLGEETLITLELAEADDPALRSRLDYRIMKAAAQVLAGRTNEALAGLSDETLLGSADAAIWRAIGAAAVGDWAMARRSTVMADAVVDAYPPVVQERFRLAAAEAAIESADMQTASSMLEKLADTGISREGAAKRIVLSGRIAQALGQIDAAQGAYRMAIAGPSPAAAAEAEFRLTDMTYSAGLVSRAAAIEALSGLTTLWRGDRTELLSLSRLASLEADEGRYRDAFMTMRSAILADPASPVTAAMQENMKNVFERLFLDDGADSMPAVDALALYFDFREMTPVGRKGDEMVRRLADRLVSVELLDQAGQLLEYQIDNRLRGAARSQIAADLAVIYLLDRKPRSAIAVLRRTDQADLPALLSRQRRLVEARALADAGEPMNAIELLDTMAGDDVDRLRVDTLWAAKDWSGTATEIERMLGRRWAEVLPLTDRERQDVLRAAVGYTLAGDTFALDRLRDKFAAKMADSPDARAFDVATRPIEGQGVEFRAVVSEIAAVDSLDGFLADYRARYLGGDRFREASAS